MLKMFNSHSADSELTKEEADIDDVGKMYHVRFMDGYETDVFEDELF